VKQRTSFLISLVGLLVFSGCQGTGKMVNFDLEAIPNSLGQQEGAQDNSPDIAVEPFQDDRLDQSRIGTRTHVSGGVTYFNAWNGSIGEGMAHLTVDYLRQKGWNAHIKTSESPPAEKKTDVILSGKILALKALAKSRFGSTKIDVRVKIGFEAKNEMDGSTVRMVLGSNGTDTVVSFDPQDVRKLTSEVLKELFGQLFKDLKVQGRTFRLRSPSAS